MQPVGRLLYAVASLGVLPIVPVPAGSLFICLHDLSVCLGSATRSKEAKGKGLCLILIFLQHRTECSAHNEA